MKKKIFKIVNLIVFFIYNRILGCFLYLKKDKIIFVSESHHELDGNLKAIFDALSDSNLELKVHMASEKFNLNGKLRLWNDLTSAKYILLDDFYSLISSLHVRKNQEIIQLWHGAGAYKKFGYSRRDTGDSSVIKFHRGYKKYTKVIVSSEYVRPYYADAFGIDLDKIYATGCPRTDILYSDYNEKIKAKVIQQFPQFKEKKIVLFAPTYRGSRVADAYYDFDKADIDEVIRQLGEDYIVAVRWHRALNDNIKRGRVTVQYCKNAIDVSEYENVNDLLIAADVLVTDYSSIIFDYALLNKPIVYFTYDEESYAYNRGLYESFDNYVYGEVAKNRDELISAIKSEYLDIDKRQEFINKFMSSCDGNATERTIRLILEK